VEPVSAVAQQLSPSAERMRRTRSRRRQGVVIVTLEIGQSAIDSLVGLGWLPETSHDKNAITGAPIELFMRAVQARVMPSTGSPRDQVCFMCTIQRSTVATLIDLGWLHQSDRDDLAAIVRAFRGFAAQALAVARNEQA